MKKDLIIENIDLLEEAKELILIIDDNQFSNADSPVFLSSAGSHFRHSLDFYTAFITGIEDGEIDYDHRERNEAVASEREVCIKKIDEIIRGLGKLEGADLGDGVTVKTIEGTTGNSSISPSNFARELQFLLSHTIHHYAMIAGILRIQGVDVPPRFGIARSTIEYYNY